MDNSHAIDHIDQPKVPHNPRSPQKGIEAIPNTPQQSPVQTTMTQSHSPGQRTPIPISEQTMSHTLSQGINPPRPHKDGSTQVPSQEVFMITSDQSTQIPSQQWEQTPESKDQENTQYETPTPEQAVSHTSFQRTGVPGTHPSPPTQSSLAKTHIANTVESHLLTVTDSRPTGTWDNNTPKTNQTMEPNNANTAGSKHTTDDDSEPASIMDFNTPDKGPTTVNTASSHTTTCANHKPVSTEGNGNPVPIQMQNTCTNNKLGTYPHHQKRGGQSSRHEPNHRKTNRQQR